MQASQRRHALEKREQDLRSKEFAREDLVRELDRDTLLKANYESETRVDVLRRLRANEQVDRERARQADWEKALQAKEQRQREQHAAEHLASEIESRKLEALRDEKFRQSVRESSQDIRDLERKLKLAYMNKERHMQLQSKAFMEEMARASESEQDRILQSRLQASHALELQKEQELRDRNVSHKREVQKQIEENERKRAEEYEKFLKEKEIIDEIVRKILEEDEKANTQRLDRQREAKQFIDDFLRERELYHASERQRMEDENRRISEYAEMQNKRELDIQSQRFASFREKEEVYQRLATELEEKEAKRAEMEQLQLELAQQEQEERLRKREKDLLEDRIRRRLELIDMYQQQLREKRERRARELQDEEDFKRKMMDKFAADDKLDQLAAHKRRLKILDHKRAVEALLLERRTRAESEKHEQASELARERELEEMRRMVVEQERQRILREHAGGLVGFLPKGVLRDKRDLELFDEDFRSKFEPKPNPAYMM